MRDARISSPFQVKWPRPCAICNEMIEGDTLGCFIGDKRLIHQKCAESLTPADMPKEEMLEVVERYIAANSKRVRWQTGKIPLSDGRFISINVYGS